MDIPNMFIAAAIAVLFIAGGISLLYSVAEEKPSVVMDGQDDISLQAFNNSFNQFAQIQTASSSMAGSINSTNTNTGTFGFIDTIIGGVWNSLKGVSSILSFIPAMIVSLDVFGVPWWAWGVLVSIFTVILTFIVLRYIFKVG